MLVDTHCHLDLAEFGADREAVVARAQAAGVRRILVPGTDLANCRRVLALANEYEIVRAAVGIDPNSAHDVSAAALAELRALAQHPKVDAVGEIGIDLHWKTVALEKQRAAFQAQLELAAELRLPVIVHDREAHADVMAALRDHAPAAGVVLHAFSGDQAMAAEAVAAGYYLGVGGPLTYKKNDALRALMAGLPRSQVLVETDAPYLTPQAKRGTRNEPAYVADVVTKLAELWNTAPESAAAVTAANAARLFRWEFSE